MNVGKGIRQNRSVPLEKGLALRAGPSGSPQTARGLEGMALRLEIVP